MNRIEHNVRNVPGGLVGYLSTCCKRRRQLRASKQHSRPTRKNTIIEALIDPAKGTEEGEKTVARPVVRRLAGGEERKKKERKKWQYLGEERSLGILSRGGERARSEIPGGSIRRVSDGGESQSGKKLNITPRSEGESRCARFGECVSPSGRAWCLECWPPKGTVSKGSRSDRWPRVLDTQRYTVAVSPRPTGTPGQITSSHGRGKQETAAPTPCLILHPLKRITPRPFARRGIDSTTLFPVPIPRGQTSSRSQLCQCDRS